MEDRSGWIEIGYGDRPSARPHTRRAECELDGPMLTNLSKAASRCRRASGLCLRLSLRGCLECNLARVRTPPQSGHSPCIGRLINPLAVWSGGACGCGCGNGSVGVVSRRRLFYFQPPARLCFFTQPRHLPDLHEGPSPTRPCFNSQLSDARIESPLRTRQSKLAQPPELSCESDTGLPPPRGLCRSDDNLSFQSCSLLWAPMLRTSRCSSARARSLDTDHCRSSAAITYRLPNISSNHYVAMRRAGVRSARFDMTSRHASSTCGLLPSPSLGWSSGP